MVWRLVRVSLKTYCANCEHSRQYISFIQCEHTIHSLYSKPWMGWMKIWIRLICHHSFVHRLSIIIITFADNSGWIKKKQKIYLRFSFSVENKIIIFPFGPFENLFFWFRFGFFRLLGNAHYFFRAPRYWQALSGLSGISRKPKPIYIYSTFSILFLFLSPVHQQVQSVTSTAPSTIAIKLKCEKLSLVSWVLPHP